MRSDFLLKPNKAALLVIDMQKHFCDERGAMYVPGVDVIIKNIQQLIALFRKNSCPVIFTRHIDSDDKDNLMLRWWDGRIEERDPMSEIIEVLDKKSQEVIKKPQYDAFLYTDLEKILKDKNVKQVVICGVLTNICCETTGRSAFMRGFEVYFLTDSTTTYTKDMHDASLLNLSYGFATLLTIDQVIKVMT